MDQPKQTDIESRYDLLPPSAVQRIAELLYEGEIRYGKDNWKSISTRDHINHALGHVFGALASLEGDPELDLVEELTHAATRLLFALALETCFLWK